jgi:signal peptidase I
MRKRYGDSLPNLTDIKKEIRREQYKSRYYSVLRSTISVLIVVAAIAVLVATLWMPVLHIYGVSMGPTLNDGEIVISVKSDSLEKGDLVAFYYGNKLLIKRCIAGPGEWVDIDSMGNVSVNGIALDEPYLAEKALGESNIKYPYQVPDARWFLMGDSRAVSIDSRNTSVGCVAQEQIVGKIVFRVWPLNTFGAIQ